MHIDDLHHIELVFIGVELHQSCRWLIYQAREGLEQRFDTGIIIIYIGPTIIFIIIIILLLLWVT